LQGTAATATDRLGDAAAVVIVTGASSGIGRVTAKAFAAKGATVVCVARREERLRELVGECAATSPTTTYLCGDLAERAFAEHVVDETVRRTGRLDVLANVAGVVRFANSDEMPEADWNLVLAVNLSGAFFLCQAAIPHLLETEGNIVNVASTNRRQEFVRPTQTNCDL
jgi:NAD(P)-dependent dehydrogenase (short-subunit alcohol dehydrogenase family)